MNRMMMVAVIVSTVIGIAGCGSNKAKEVLCLQESAYCGGYKVLEKSAELVEMQDKLSADKKKISEQVETIVNNRIQKEWIPQLLAKAKSLGVQDFTVSIDENVGALVVPGSEARKFVGCVFGSAKAAGDETHFIVDIVATVQQDGSVAYEFKK